MTFDDDDIPPADLPLPAPPTADPAGPDTPADEDEVILPDKPVVALDTALIDVAQVHELENSRACVGDLTSLAENIRVRGLLHPVKVRPAHDRSHGCDYELVVGYRRLAAFRVLERPQIPAVIEDRTDEEVLAELISENSERENPTALDEARTMQRMIDLFGWSHRQVAAQLGVDRSQVTKRLGLLKLPVKVQTMVGERQLSASHAEVIARLDREDSQEELADLAVKSEASVSKLHGYASKIKERDDERVEEDDPEAPGASDADTPLDMLCADDIVRLPRLNVRAELTAADLARANLYVLLRSANDEEMLDTLSHTFGVAYAQLWDWVKTLSDEQVTELTETMLRRWLGAAHRYPTLPEDLRDRYGAGHTFDAADGVALPDGTDGPDDWDDDFDDWDDEDDDSEVF